MKLNWFESGVLFLLIGSLVVASELSRDRTKSVPSRVLMLLRRITSNDARVASFGFALVLLGVMILMKAVSSL